MLKQIKLLIFIFSCTFMMSLQAASVLSLGLNNMYSAAGYIFRGTCIENRVEYDDQLGAPVTYTRFAVAESFKGDLRGDYTIKQLGGSLSGDHIAFEVDGIPNFLPGEDYVLFLPAPSVWGFSSPVGLWQGKFTIFPGEGGLEVSNGRDMEELLQDLPENLILPAVLQDLKARRRESAKARTRLRLEDFQGILRNRGQQ